MAHVKGETSCRGASGVDSVSSALLYARASTAVPRCVPRRSPFQLPRPRCGAIVSGHMISRRAFLGGSVVLLAAPLAAKAQQAGRVWRVGILGFSAKTRDLIGPRPRRPSLTAFLEGMRRSEEHTSELQSHVNLVCRLLLEKKKKKKKTKVKKMLQKKR